MLRYSLRRVRRSPGFATVAIATLALGIGANVAIFSVVDAVLLRPLAYRQPDRLVAVAHAATGLKIDNLQAAPFLYFMYREEAKSFERLTLWASGTETVTSGSHPERGNAIYATHDLFPTLGVSPILGRAYSAADDKPGAPLTIVLSWAYWQSRFGGSPSVLGKRLIADGKGYEIIGVMPRGFRVMDTPADFYMPWQPDRSKVRLGQFGRRVIGQLRPGVTIEAASREATRLLPISFERFPTTPGFDRTAFTRAGIIPAFQPLKESLVGESGPFLWIVLTAVGMLLLIACANVANLLLVRADGRSHELAVRAALGAGSGRIAGELLTESLTLAGIGGALGIALAAAAIRALPSIAPSNIPRLEDVALDGEVLLFALGVTLFSGLLFGLIPALRGTGAALNKGLRAGGRSLSDSRERNRMRGVLVVAQVALALLLTIGAGLMLRTFSALRAVEPGFTQPDDLLTFSISIPRSQVGGDDAAVHMQQDILNRISGVPGVTSVALSTTVPFTDSVWNDPIYVETRSYADQAVPPLRKYRFASPGRAKTMGAKLVSGRDFTWEDHFDKRMVAMVSENMAREIWGSPAAALGKRIRENLAGEWRQVVGVVGDERSEGVSSPAPSAVYFPLLMADFSHNKTWAAREPFVIVRSSRAGSLAFLEEVRRAVNAVSPSTPLADVRTIRDRFDRSTARISFTMILLALAGGMALLLGIIGVYGVIAYSVARRTREIGIRTALGARSSDLTRNFALRGLALAGVGVVAGIGAAIPLTRFLQSLLFGVKPADPMTWIAAAFGLLCAAALASYLPARRVARVNPMDALRSE